MQKGHTEAMACALWLGLHVYTVCLHGMLHVNNAVVPPPGARTAPVLPDDSPALVWSHAAETPSLPATTLGHSASLS